jgi:hypothetical protein
VKVSARDPKTGAAHSATVSMSSGLSEQELQGIVTQARTQNVVGSSSPSVAPASSHAEGPDEDEEFLELPPIESEMAPAPPAGGAEPACFGEIDGDLALPDEDEHTARIETQAGGSVDFDKSTEIGSLADGSATEAELEVMDSDESALGEMAADEILLDHESNS